MPSKKTTVRKLWSLQQITDKDVDYLLWEEKQQTIRRFAALQFSGIFTVDVYKERYDFASDHFTEYLGLKTKWIRHIRQQGDILEDSIHPDDREALLTYQIEHGKFIQSLPPDRRNDFQQTFRFRMRNARRQYIPVTSRQQVVQTNHHGKAWIIMGIMDFMPDNSYPGEVSRTLWNRKTGEILANSMNTHPENPLTERETEILHYIRQGYLSKEIAYRLGVSIFTIHNHRKQILSKLQANNSIEALRHAEQIGLLPQR